MNSLPRSHPLVFALLLALGLTHPLFAQTFTPMTSGNVVTDSGDSHGMAWGDYDGDGFVDLFVANASGQNNFLYHNNGNGTFTKITAGSIVNDGGVSASCAWGDYDNDGHLDLFVANVGQNNFLYHNNGDGTFTKITSGNIVTDVGGSFGCAWGDYDNDGYVDLYVANASGGNFLYHNNGDGTFSRVTTGNIVTDNQNSISCAWGDYDNDGWIDLFVANGANENNALYHNNQDGTFTKITVGSIVSEGGLSVGCAWADYDNDGYLDLFVANRQQQSFLYHNNRDGTFTKVTSGGIATDVLDANGCSWGDFDNDGDLDLFVATWNGQNDALYQNNGDGTFTRVTTGSVVTVGGNGVGGGWGDFNNDGQLDLFVSNSGGQNNFLYRNEGNHNSWITIQCVGAASNRSGVGARVSVAATIQGKLRSQARQISTGNGWDGQGLSAHFGLGDAAVIATLQIKWPSGAVQTLNNVAVNQTLTVSEPSIVTPDSFTKITSGSVVNDQGNSIGSSWVDFNNDGHLDLFVANYGGGNFLYQNDGEGNFTKITSGSIASDAARSHGCAWGDYDNDGFLDLFVANRQGENNALYHNNGTGTFTKITSGIVVNDGGDSAGCAWGDYDNDGYIDLFVANIFGNNSLYRNNGDGTFSKVTSVVENNGPSVGCAWGDYDNDGFLDLFVANGAGRNDFLYHNNGDGTFTRITSGSIVNDGGESESCAWADYDNDGYLDLFVANRLGNNFLYHNNGDGTFTKIISGDIVNDGGESNTGAWGDYDNDGNLDLFVANWQGHTNFLYHNNGDGTFTKITSGSIVNEVGESDGCAWGDYDNDGFLDLFVANVSNANNFLYRNNGNRNNWITIKCVGSASNRAGIGAKVRLKTVVSGAERWQARQISGGDGWSSENLLAHFGLADATNIDTIRVEWPSGAVQTLNNVAVNQTLTVSEPSIVPPDSFTKITAGSIVNDIGNSFAAEWGDYDNDGLLDLFVGNAYGPNIFNPYLFRNNGDGTFTKNTTASFVNESGNICAWGDFDNDGKLDLFVGNAFGKNSLYHSNGDGTFTRITAGSIVNDIAIAQSCSWVDYDNDGFLDLFVVNGGGAASQNNFLYHNNGDGTFTRVTSGSIATDSGFGVGGAWADYDNDGYLDLFVANLSGKNALYHNQRDGTFTRITQGDIANEGTAGEGCAWGDYDNDGFPDLFVANGGGQNNFLYHNNGDGTFTKITTGSIVNDGGYSVGAAWADYDNDGYLDLFVANRLGKNFLYHNNGDGTFTKITTGTIVSEAADSNGVAWGDYNNDGFLDLFVANWKNERNFLYLNKGNTNNWIKVRCAGTISNRSGVGAKVKVQARLRGNLRCQLRQIGGFDSLGSTSLDAHFGLGNATVIANLRVEWPSGAVQTLDNVAVNQTLTVTELVAPPGVAVVTTLAGSGAPGFADGQGVAAQFHFPNGGFVDAGGFVCVADGPNHRIRRVSPNGAVTTLAGSAAAGARDGPGAIAGFNYPLGVFVVPAGDVFVADTENNLVRKISPTGFRNVSTVAGSGQPGYLDGPGATAKFNFPNDLVVDAAGNIFVSEFNNHTIRKITPDGAVSTFVGNGAAGYADGRGTSARLNQPGGLAIDKNGNLFVTDWGNQRIRRVTPDGIVTTLAGSGLGGFVDGPASIAQFKEPDGITVDQDGNLFITEHGNHAVRKIARDGTVTTVAGKGAAGFADGTAASALFNAPGGIGIDNTGNLFVADTGNHRIRKITFGTPPQIVVQPLSQSVALGAAVSFRVEATGTPPLSYQWRINGTNWNGQTQPTLVISHVTAADAGSWTVGVSNALGSVTSVAAELSVVATPPVVSSAMRQLPSEYFPGIRFTVTVAADPPIGTTVYAVEDHPPAGWTVANLNNGGRFDVLNQAVKFGPFFDADARVLAYEITPAANESGTKRFSGTISVDGSSVPIGGADVINSEPLHPADTNPADHRIAIDELTAYSAAWRKGQSWVNPPNPIPIDYVTRAGALWKNGEAYHLDPRVSAPPLWWVNDINGPSVGQQSLTRRSVVTATSMVTPETPDHFIITEPFTVTLHVTPSGGVSVYAAEDQIGYPGYPADSPSGLQITNISHNGEYDANGRQIRWGPFFDNQPRNLSYQVMIADTPPGLLEFTGNVSFDGASIPIPGKREVVAGSRLSLILGQKNYRIQIQLTGSGTYRIEASTNLIDWTAVMEAIVLKDMRFIDLNAREFRQRYYRSREIR